VNWVGLVLQKVRSVRLLAYNFAVSGATTDDSIVHTPAESGIDDQVALFKDHVSKDFWTANNTMAILWVGVNDLGFPYFDEYMPPIDKVMTRYAELLGTLYSQGLRRYSLFTVPRKTKPFPVHQCV
jgi:hypothetical protein